LTPNPLARPGLATHLPRLCAAGVLLLAGLARAGCDPALATSPQFSAADCVFQNPVNPRAQPSQPAWKIWSRFLGSAPPGTTPVDAIPVRPLTRAALAALDNTSNHVIRLGHSSHLLKLRGRWWLIDPVFGERVSPVSLGRADALSPVAAGAGRPAAHRRPGAVARPLRPPRRADHRPR
jgi:hypothetical protein